MVERKGKMREARLARKSSDKRQGDAQVGGKIQPMKSEKSLWRKPKFATNLKRYPQAQLFLLKTYCLPSHELNNQKISINESYPN